MLMCTYTMQTTGISDAVIMQIFYTVNGRDEEELSMTYPRSKSVTDILLPGVAYNDDISVQFSVRNITVISERSDLLTLRMCKILNFICRYQYVLIIVV